MKRAVCLVLPGAGTRLGAIAGAVEVLSTYLNPVAFAGTSGGGLVALALAFGLPPQNVSELCTHVLLRTDLLDRGVPLLDDGPALYRGRKIREILREVFGETKMRDLQHPARVGVASLWTQRVGLVDSVRHGEVLVRDAAYATMAIEGVFDPGRLRSDNARTYGDGGAGLNVPAGAWDDRDEQTVVARFKEQQSVHTLFDLMNAVDGNSDQHTVEAVRTGPELLAASFGVMMGAASAAFPSRKSDTVEVVIESTGDGLKFGLDAAEDARRRTEGATSAKQWIAARSVDVAHG